MSQIDVTICKNSLGLHPEVVAVIISSIVEAIIVYKLCGFHGTFRSGLDHFFAFCHMFSQCIETIVEAASIDFYKMA